MKCIFAPILIFTISISTYAETFNIEGTELLIPSPSGFTRVNKQMDAVYRLSLQMADPKNDLLAYYISNSEIPTAMKGEIPPLKRTFVLKVNKELKNIIVGSDDFNAFKNVTKRQNKETFEKIKSQISDLMKEQSKGISKEFDLDIALQISQMIPLDPHYEVDDALAYSMYANYGISAEGSEEELILAATSAFVNVSGKILFLYCYGSQDELEWTRSASKSWIEGIIESNTAPPANSPSNGINWSRALEKGIVGAVTGGLIALIIGALSYFKKKRNG